MTKATDANDGRDDVRAALADEDPIGTLRKVAIDLSARLPRGAVRFAFAAVSDELADQGRDDEAAIVADVVDMLDEWHAGGRAPG
jgi:hypothetical protein